MSQEFSYESGIEPKFPNGRDSTTGAIPWCFLGWVIAGKLESKTGARVAAVTKAGLELCKML